MSKTPEQRRSRHHEPLAVGDRCEYTAGGWNASSRPTVCGVIQSIDRLTAVLQLDDGSLRSFPLSGLSYQPTFEEITKRAAEVQSQWDEATREERSTLKNPPAALISWCYGSRRKSAEELEIE